MNPLPGTQSRQVAFQILQEIEQRQTYTDIALDRGLRSSGLSGQDRGWVTELVYGVVRRRRSLDTLIDQLGRKPAHQQPPNFRLILQLGLYQLRYLSHIPAAAAVNTSVELAKKNHFAGLAGVVNGVLRQYIRLSQGETDPLRLPTDPIQRLGVLHSFPDWLTQQWVKDWGERETETLYQWFNQTPTIDLRINSLKTNPETVKQAFQAENIPFSSLENFPYALRLGGGQGAISTLPGFSEGQWMVQEASAQLVTYLLDPQPHEVIIDACAAPGGKTTHIAELMQDTGLIWACDRTPSRLKKVQENIDRLQLSSVRLQLGDSRHFPQFQGQGDRVLLDVPCSGLGTLHRHPDIRWRQNPQKIQTLTQLQRELLQEAATWVKPGGVLVYSTCTLNPSENEEIVRDFLYHSPQWQVELPDPSFPLISLVSSSGWLHVFPHQQEMDGFFMVKLRLGK